MKKILLSVLFVLLPNTLIASPLKDKLDSLLENKTGVAVSLVDLETDAEVYSKNHTQGLKPASIMKLATSYALLNKMGPEFRFYTTIYASDFKNGFVNKLTIVGGGAPDLTIEQLWLLARKIKRRGIKNIQTLVLDDSIYKTFKEKTGEHAYEAGNSGLALNHNSILFEICSGDLNSRARIVSDPWEYSIILNGEIKTVKSIKKGYAVSEIPTKHPKMKYLVSGEILSSNKCLEVYRSVDNPFDYLSQVFLKILKGLDVQVNEVRKNTDNKEALGKKLFSLASKPLSLLIYDMNHFSNNFIAEQILLALDDENQTLKLREKALDEMRKEVSPLSESDSEFFIDDASGLSLQNKFSAKFMTNLLKESYKNPFWGVEFLNSLPIGGKSGTLKTRNLKFQSGVVRAKTGTLSDVSSLAGFLFFKNKKYAFTIIQNNRTSRLAKHKLEEDILREVINE